MLSLRWLLTQAAMLRLPPVTVSFSSPSQHSLPEQSLPELLSQAFRHPLQLASELLDAHTTSTIKCAVPALCYTIQNYLIYFSLANLEIVVFQLVYQSKLLMAAVLSVAILGNGNSSTRI